MGLPVASHSWSVEGYWGSRWHDLPVRASPPIAITRGIRGETGGLTPQTASLTLDGQTDSWNPYDPGSLLFDQVGRNWPVRIAQLPTATTGDQADARATWTATSASGWATADVGGAWTYTGTSGTVAASEYTQSSGQGIITINGAGYIRAAHLASLTGILDVDMTVTWTAPLALTQPLKVVLLLRGTGADSNTAIQIHHTIAPDTSITIDGYDHGGDAYPEGSFICGFAHTGAAVTTRVRTIGSKIWVKTWRTSGTEPDLWNITYTDTAAPVRGWIGLRCSRILGNTNTAAQIKFDNLAATVSEPRFIGEVAGLNPTQTVGYDGTSGDRTCGVDAAGTMRRLVAANAPARGTLYRWLAASADTLAYWPLEEEAGAQTLAEVIGSPRPGAYTGTPELGADAGTLYGAARVVTLTTGQAVSLPVARATDDGWHVSLLVRLDATPGSATTVATVSTVAGTAATWTLTADATGWTITATTAAGATSDTTTLAYGTGATPGSWVYMHLEAHDDGATVTWDAKWYPVGTSVIYWTTARTFAGVAGHPSNIRVGGTTACSIGHVALANWGRHDPVTLAQLSTGYTGETVEARLSRLCDEAAVPFALAGTVGATDGMGAQSIGQMVDLLAECSLADQGVLYESRVDPGFAYRPLADLYNQTAVLTLDATSGTDIAPGSLTPVIDDLPTENDVTAARLHGSEYRATDDVSRMGTMSPPDGAGRVASQYDVSLADDDQLPDWAGWRLHLGTVDEPRWPTVTVDLDANPGLSRQATLVDIGDVIEIQNVGNVGTVRLVVVGIDETAGNDRHTITYNCRPGGAYDVLVLDDPVRGCLASGVAYLEADYVAGTDTSMQVGYDVTGHEWGDGATDVNLRVGGDVVHATNVTSAYPQVFTVDVTLVSGVAKTIPIGSRVDLATLNHLGK